MPYLKCHARVKQGHVVGECREVDYGKSPGVDAEYGEKSVISPRASVEAENAQQACRSSAGDVKYMCGMAGIGIRPSPNAIHGGVAMPMSAAMIFLNLRMRI